MYSASLATSVLEVLFGDYEVVRNQQGSFFLLCPHKVVEPYFRLFVGDFLFHFVLVEGVQFFQPLVRIGVHGTEFEEVEYTVVAAYTLRLVDYFPLLSKRMAIAVAISSGDSIRSDAVAKRTSKVRFHKGR